MENSQNIELFESYLENRLSSEEKSSFEVRLLMDPDFYEDFSNYRKIANGLRDLGTEKVRLRLRMFDKELDSAKKNPTGSFWIWSTLGVAAILCIVFLTRYQGESDLISVPPDEGLPVSMGSLHGNLGFENAMQLFKSGDFSGALTGFRLIQNDIPNNDTLLYYAGFSEMMLLNYENAINDFNKVLFDGSSDYLLKSRYYLAFCYYQNSMLTEARKALHPLVSDPKNPFPSETERFMQVLDEKEK